MRLLDSNLFIYASKGQFRPYIMPLLASKDTYASEFTMLEALGFPMLIPIEKLFLENAFSGVELIAIDTAIINKAIELRQQRKMSAGDAIHAATALLHNLELNTRNEADFNWIVGLNVVNPIP
jgi:toxin FitB